MHSTEVVSRNPPEKEARGSYTIFVPDHVFADCVRQSTNNVGNKKLRFCFPNDLGPGADVP